MLKKLKQKLTSVTVLMTLAGTLPLFGDLAWLALDWKLEAMFPGIDVFIFSFILFCMLFGIIVQAYAVRKFIRDGLMDFEHEIVRKHKEVENEKRNLS